MGTRNVNAVYQQVDLYICIFEWSPGPTYGDNAEIVWKFLHFSLGQLYLTPGAIHFVTSESFTSIWWFWVNCWSADPRSKICWSKRSLLNLMIHWFYKRDFYLGYKYEWEKSKITVKDAGKKGSDPLPYFQSIWDNSLYQALVDTKFIAVVLYAQNHGLWNHFLTHCVQPHWN